MTKENHVLPNESEQMSKTNLKINLGFTPPCDARDHVNVSIHSHVENDKGKGKAAADLKFKKIITDIIGGFPLY